MKVFNFVRQPLFVPDGNEQGDDSHQESGKVTFTAEQQAHMDKVISQRITSVKASYAGFEDMKEITEALEQFGYVGTVAEKKAAFKAYAEENRKAKELEELQEEAEEKGSSPELLAEIKALKKDLAEIKNEKEQQKKQEQENKKLEETWKEQVEEFANEHKDVDVPKLYENKKFMEFVADSRAGLTLLQVYNKYIALIGDAEKAAIDKIKSNNDRSTSSGKAKGNPEAGTYGLSDYHQKLAKENKMTNKEYAELFNQVKK